MFCNFYSIEFTTKKGKIGSDKRKINFVIGASDQMNIKTSGLINKDATIYIGTGLPNTTSTNKTLLSCNLSQIFCRTQHKSFQSAEVQEQQ